MQLGLSQFFRTQLLEKKSCSTESESRVRAWLLPQRFGAGLRPMHWLFLERPMFVQLCLSCKYWLHADNIGRKVCVPPDAVSLLLAAVVWGQNTECRRGEPEWGRRTEREWDTGSRLRTEVKERRSGKVGVGMMRKEGHLAAVAEPQMAEGNCHATGRWTTPSNIQCGIIS